MPILYQKILRYILCFSGALLLIDGLWLILSARINFGSIVPACLGMLFLACGYYWQSIQQKIHKAPLLKKLWRLLWLLFFAWLFSFILFVAMLQYKAKVFNQQPKYAKAIIVLGSGIRNGQPSPALKNRLDKAAMLSRELPDIPIIVSGGLGLGRVQTEAEVMAHYLQQTQHIPMSQIHLENQSTSTELNLKNSEPILQQMGISTQQPIAIVTNDFHILRSYAIAKKQGYQHPIMIASPTPPSIRFNTWLREYFAFISGWILREY